MRAYRLYLGEESLVYRLAYKGEVVAFKMGRRHDPGRPISTRFRNVWRGRDALPRGSAAAASDDRVGCSASDGRCAPARPALYVSTRFRTCGAVGTRSRAEPPSSVQRPCPVQRLGWPIRSGASGVARFDPSFVVLYSFHDCVFCERAAPDAPETIDDQRRCTGCRDRTIYGGSRGSASLPRRRSGSALSLLERFLDRSAEFWILNPDSITGVELIAGEIEYLIAIQSREAAIQFFNS